MTYNTTLDGAISASQTEIYVDDLPTAPVPKIVQIGSEAMELGWVHGDFSTAADPTKRIRLGVTRGALGTVPATHADTAAVSTYSGGSGGGVNVDNGTDPPAAVSTLVAPGADVSTTPGEANINVFDNDGKFLVNATANLNVLVPAFEVDAITGVNRLVRVKSGTVEIFKVDKDGSLGLNNGAADQLFQVLTNGDAQFYMQDGDAQFSIFRFGSFSPVFYIDSDGSMHIGNGGKVGFLGATPVTRPTVTGSRGGNAALASLLTALATLGLITDSSS